MSDSKNNQVKSITGLNDIDVDEIIINGQPLDYIGLANSFPAYLPQKYLRCNSAGTAVELTSVVEADIDLTQQSGVIVFQQTAGVPPANSIYHGIKFDDTNAIGFPTTSTESLVLSALNPVGAGGGEYYLKVNWGTPTNGKYLKYDTAATPPYTWVDEADPVVGLINGIIAGDGTGNFKAVGYTDAGLTFPTLIYNGFGTTAGITDALQVKLNNTSNFYLENTSDGIDLRVSGGGAGYTGAVIGWDLTPPATIPELKWVDGIGLIGFTDGILTYDVATNIFLPPVLTNNGLKYTLAGTSNAGGDLAFFNNLDTVATAPNSLFHGGLQTNSAGVSLNIANNWAVGKIIKAQTLAGENAMGWEDDDTGDPTVNGVLTYDTGLTTYGVVNTSHSVEIATDTLPNYKANVILDNTTLVWSEILATGVNLKVAGTPADGKIIKYDTSTTPAQLMWDTDINNNPTVDGILTYDATTTQTYGIVVDSESIAVSIDSGVNYKADVILDNTTLVWSEILATGVNLKVSGTPVLDSVMKYDTSTTPPQLLWATDTDTLPTVDGILTYDATTTQTYGVVVNSGSIAVSIDSGVNYKAELMVESDPSVSTAGGTGSEQFVITSGAMSGLQLNANSQPSAGDVYSKVASGYDWIPNSATNTYPAVEGVITSSIVAPATPTNPAYGILSAGDALTIAVNGTLPALKLDIDMETNIVLKTAGLNQITKNPTGIQLNATNVPTTTNNSWRFNSAGTGYEWYNPASASSIGGNPIGAIIMYAGAHNFNIPPFELIEAGGTWAICDGGTTTGHTVPSLLNKFVMGGEQNVIPNEGLDNPNTSSTDSGDPSLGTFISEVPIDNPHTHGATPSSLQNGSLRVRQTGEGAAQADTALTLDFGHTHGKPVGNNPATPVGYMAAMATSPAPPTSTYCGTFSSSYNILCGNDGYSFPNTGDVAGGAGPSHTHSMNSTGASGIMYIAGTTAISGDLSLTNKTNALPPTYILRYIRRIA